MNDTILIFTFLISFFATVISTKVLIRKIAYTTRKKKGCEVVFLGKDMVTGRMVPKMGGLAITAGFALSIFITLKLVRLEDAVPLLATMNTILIISLIGLMDDLFKVRQIWRVLLPGLAALPLMAITAGVTDFHFIFMHVNLGIYYSLVLVPIGVMACSNLINNLAGHNGLEAGTGAVICLSIFAASYLLSMASPDEFGIAAPLIMLAMAAACLAFLLFNWYPAKIFPENIGTYAIAAAIASAVIIGNIERIGIIALIPQIAEFLLKARSRFRAQNWGKLVRGRLHYDGKIYSLTHILMKYTHPTEQGLTIQLILIQIVFGILAVSSIWW
jgi:UDP-N-acetylglucosamine--dolichyl-phosphate N-acetylglucosaminephosphotransferase